MFFLNREAAKGAKDLFVFLLGKNDQESKNELGRLHPIPLSVWDLLLPVRHWQWKISFMPVIYGRKQNLAYFAS